MTLADLFAFKELDDFTGEIKWLWHCDYWDGPLSGMVQLRGHQYWAQMFDEITATNVDGSFQARRFAVIPLSDTELAAEQADHRLFRTYVGEHTDYGDGGKRAVGATRPQSEWNEYYANSKIGSRDYSKHKVIGYFEM